MNDDADGLIDAYLVFMREARPFLRIADEPGYRRTLNVLETVLERAEDTLDDPMNPLIDLLSVAVAQYEAQDQEAAASGGWADAVSLDGP